MNKIGITLSESAYTPEAYAYEKHLSKLGYQVQLDYDLDPNNDINIYFMGVRPFYKNYVGRAKEIHEYQSLSTFPYAKLKDLFKKFGNKKPDGRIFLNKDVSYNLNFSDGISFIYRDMGVDEALFQNPIENPEYDILYCGSIHGRNGLIETLLNISKNYKILIVGKVTETERNSLHSKNITFMGVVGRELLPEIYRNVRFGLNYTPDIYPYNIQTSTKTLEYLASGLNVISNKYKWAEIFFNEIGYCPIWIDKDGFVNNMDKYAIRNIDSTIIRQYSWENILSGSNLNKFLKEVLNETN